MRILRNVLILAVVITLAPVLLAVVFPGALPDTAPALGGVVDRSSGGAAVQDASVSIKASNAGRVPIELDGGRVGFELVGDVPVRSSGFGVMDNALDPRRVRFYPLDIRTTQLQPQEETTMSFVLFLGRDAEFVKVAVQIDGKRKPYFGGSEGRSGTWGSRAIFDVRDAGEESQPPAASDVREAII